MSDENTAPSANEPKLLPLDAGGENEKVANLLAQLVNADDPSRAANTALIILVGLQGYLNTGNAESAAAAWEPIITARALKKQFGNQAYREALKRMPDSPESHPKTYALFQDVAQILLSDPEQEKFPVDPKQ